MHVSVEGSGQRLALPAPRSPVPVLLPPPVAPISVPRRAGWAVRYSAALLAAETLTAAVVATLLAVTRPGPVSYDTPLVWAALALVPAWPLLLVATGAHDEWLFGAGSDEYRRVVRAGLLLLATAGFVSYAVQLDLSRALVVVGVPTLTVVTCLLRAAARWQLLRLRRGGACTKRVLVVGRGGAVLDLVGHLSSDRTTGLCVVAACVAAGDRERVAEVSGLPVGGLDDVLEVARTAEVDTIAVTSASETAASYLRRLSWQLEGTGIELLVSPGLVEVAGPRLRIRPYEGLPLLSVEQPCFQGWRRIVKGGVDRLGAVAAILALSPLLAAVALTVRLSGPGPVLYRQERVGVNGRAFTMYKFRSMVVGAEARLEGLRASSDADGPLFKLRTDPRVTRVGGWLRRWSLDELPQLFNVVGGAMSLVGPRPPLPHEVARYDSSASRRLLVKPGLTGLWQVSGRSDLPWDEAVRLDLRYVENWSLTTDFRIMWRTARAVLSRTGAY